MTDKHYPKLVLSAEIDNIGDLMNVKWLNGDLTDMLNDLPLTEQLTLDFNTGVCTLEIINEIGETIKSQEVKNRSDISGDLINTSLDCQTKEEIKAYLSNIWDYTEFPFERNELSVDLLIKLCKFIKYPNKNFYYSIPFTLGTYEIFGSFTEIAGKMRSYDNIPEIFENSSLPKTKDFKDIMFSNLEYFFYLPEIEKLWGIIDDKEIFVSILSTKEFLDGKGYMLFYNITDFLSGLNMCPAVFEFCRDYLKITSIENFHELMDSYFFSTQYACYYVALDEYCKKEEQKRWKHNFYDDDYFMFNGFISPFNHYIPQEKYLPDDITINSYDFTAAKSSEEYDEASKEIDRKYSEHHLPIILVKKFGKLEAVIEIRRYRRYFEGYAPSPTAYLSMKDYVQIKEPKCGNEELYNAYKLFCERNSLNMQFKDEEDEF